MFVFFGCIVSPFVFLVDVFVILIVLFVLLDFGCGTLVVRFVFVGFVVFFDFIFKNRAAGCGVGLHFLANLILLCFAHAGREHGGFFVADFGLFAHTFAFVRIAVEVFLFGFVFSGGCGAYVFGFLSPRFWPSCRSAAPAV